LANLVHNRSIAVTLPASTTQIEMRRYIITILLLIIAQTSFGQKTILWRVIDTINHKTSTIVGTYHHFGNSFVDSIPEIKENLYNSELAIFESIDKVNQVSKLINSREKLQEIKKKLNRKDYWLLLKLSENWEVDIHKLRPFELRIKLQQEFIKAKCETVQKNDKWNHFDNYLRHLAKEKNIKLYGLESYKEQLELINRENKSSNWKGEKKKISYLLDQLKRSDFNEKHCNLAMKYKNYDLEYKFDEGCKTVVLKERNDNWMKILPQMLRKQNCFIAVGLFHLYSKCGLLEQLKGQGFIVEPIELKPAGNKI